MHNTFPGLQQYAQLLSSNDAEFPYATSALYANNHHHLGYHDSSAAHSLMPPPPPPPPQQQQQDFHYGGGYSTSDFINYYDPNNPNG
uniref:Ethylene-responsive transcription factor ERF113 n=1 Tax=Salvia miltiorrhiza TaxID=226208 RepID=A0A2U8UYP0_SALMI|nr:ethylene-responsive transcription factor ERF113 [Salvia miltiorrhiza]